MCVFQVEYFCFDCWEPLCAACTAAHKRTKQTKTHKLKPFSDVTQDDVQQRKQLKMANCDVHEEQKLMLYCTTCDQMGCNTCAVIKHRNHECLELNDADARFVGRIGAVLEQLKPVCSKYQDDLLTLTTATETLKTNCNKLSNDVEVVLTKTESEFRAVFDNFMLQLNSTRHVVKQTVQELQDNCEAKLNTEKQQYEKAIDDVKLKMSKCENMLLISSNVFERFNLIKQLPSIECDSVQALSSNCMENVKSSKATLNAWKSGVTQWQEMAKGVASNVTTSLSQLNLPDVLIQRYLITCSKVGYAVGPLYNRTEKLINSPRRVFVKHFIRCLVKLSMVIFKMAVTAQL
jgi:hypothetical protein